MITVHHLNRSRSKRVIWLLEELKLPYEVVHHERDKETMLAPKSLKKVHPLGKSPVIESNGITLCESGAITEYLLDQNQGNTLRPEKHTPAYYQYLQWLHFAEGSLAWPVIINMMLGLEDREEQKFIDSYISKEVKLDLDFIENVLSSQPYFAGDDFTAADIMMTASLEIASSQGLIDAYSAIQDYLARISQRPSYLKAVEFG